MFNTQIAVDEFARLQKEYGFRTCFETGTHTGVGSLGASEFCELVITSELNPDRRDEAIKRFIESGYSLASEFKAHDEKCFVKGSKQINSLLGNSPECLRHSLRYELNPNIKPLPQPYCFYLDAHWDPNNWPLRPELQVIADFKLADSVIIIHDAKVPQDAVPGNGLGYDSYNGQDLDYDYVKDLLAAINPNYKIRYNEQGPRGILYALP